MGPQVGRVVNLEITGDFLLRFAPVDNFWSWYERWLDDVITGKLGIGAVHWNGYDGTKAPLLSVKWA